MQSIPLFILLSIAVAAVPGPSNLFVVAQGLTRSIWRILFALLGIVVANALWLLFSATGIALLVASFDGAIRVIRFAGVFYLTYLGFKLIFSQHTEAEDQAVRASPYSLVCLQGFLTSITNPKAALFYAAFLPQFVSSDAYPMGDLIVLGIGYIFIVVVIFFSYGALAAYAADRAVNYVKPLKRVVGLGFIVSALSLWRWKPQ